MSDIFMIDNQRNKQIEVKVFQSKYMIVQYPLFLIDFLFYINRLILEHNVLWCSLISPIYFSYKLSVRGVH